MTANFESHSMVDNTVYYILLAAVVVFIFPVGIHDHYSTLAY